MLEASKTGLMPGCQSSLSTITKTVRRDAAVKVLAVFCQIAVLFSVALPGISQSSTSSTRSTPVGVGDIAPEFTLEDQNHDKFTLADALAYFSTEDQIMCFPFRPQLSAAHDCAMVQSVTGAPVDSKTGRTWFERGIRGLQAKLDLLWRRNEGYYLGEWHFHPFGAPIPSSIDNKQLQKISRSRLYRCPEPLLIILGGDPAASWSLRCFLFLRGSKEPTHLCYLQDQTRRTAAGRSDLPPAFRPTDCATYVIDERSKALTGDS